MYWVFILHLFSLIVILDMLSALFFFLVLFFRHLSCTLSLFCRFPQTPSFIIFRFLKMPARYFFPYHNLKRAGCFLVVYYPGLTYPAYCILRHAGYITHSPGHRHCSVPAPLRCRMSPDKKQRSYQQNRTPQK